MLINHITEADYQKLLKAKENAGKVKEKVGYNKNPIKLPLGRFSMAIMAPKTCKEGAWQYCNYGYDKTIYNSRDECMKGELVKCEGSETNNMRKTFIALILLAAVVLLFYSINPKKTA